MTFTNVNGKVMPSGPGGWVPNPANVIILSSTPPSTAATDVAIGTLGVKPGGPIYICINNTGINGSVTWAELAASGGGAVATINSNAPVAGNYVLAGTTNQINKADTTGTTTFSLSSTLVAPGSVAATTTLTATLGDITATNGDFVASTAAKGPKVVGTSASGATPVTNSVRAGQVSFTDDISAAATVALTLTNTLITSASVIIATVSCATSGSACVIRDIAPGSGSVIFNVTNLGGSTATANININFWVLN
jgi:hypothetical protein